MEEANTSKMTMAMTTETETATTRDTSSRRRMRAVVVEAAKDLRGDTRRRTRTTRQEEGTQTEAVVIRGREAVGDEEARTRMRRTHHREATAEAMAEGEMRLHHAATAGDTKVRVDHPGRIWREEVRRGVPGAQI